MIEVNQTMTILRNRLGWLITLFFLVLSITALPVAAEDALLTNNSGAGNAVYFIQDEPSLVINGFDLTPSGVQLPTAIMAVSISVDKPVPGSFIHLVIYQDANGGSPVDATLVYRQRVSLNVAGVNRIVLDRPALITEPVIWVGFYLPIDFRFHADQSGSSVLTYWAWTPGGSFDLASLASAEVLGPGDGSEPVGIAMDGIARITAETRTPEYDEMAAAYTLTEQLPEQLASAVAQDLSALRVYDNCQLLLHDPADHTISVALSFPLECRIAEAYEAPNQIANPVDQILEADRAGPLYKLSTFLSEEQRVPGRTSQLPVRVTHCMRIPSGDLERAVMAEVRESETAGERWFILPTVRINDVVCAEVSVAHYLSYFVPRTVESAPNVNLVVGYPRVEPHPLICGTPTKVYVPIVNTGLNWFDTPSGSVSVALEDYHVRTGVSTARYVLQVKTDQFGPGVRRVYPLGPISVTRNINELHRLEVRVDDAKAVGEVNKADNVWFTEYVLAPFGDDDDDCADPEELARLAQAEFDDWQQRLVDWEVWEAYCLTSPVCNLVDNVRFSFTVPYVDFVSEHEERCRQTASVCSWDTHNPDGADRDTTVDLELGAT